MTQDLHNKKQMMPIASTSAATPKAIEAPPAIKNPPDITLPESSNLISFEPVWNEDINFDLMKIVSELDKKSQDQLANPTVPPAVPATMTTSTHFLQQHQKDSPMFSGCQIGKIIINIVKKK